MKAHNTLPVNSTLDALRCRLRHDVEGHCVFAGFFWQNPQFCFVLSKDDGDDSKQACSFILALMQKHQRRRGITLSLALHVYQVHAGSSLTGLCIHHPWWCCKRHCRGRCAAVFDVPCFSRPTQRTRIYQRRS